MLKRLGLAALVALLIFGLLLNVDTPAWIDICVPILFGLVVLIVTMDRD